MKKEIIIHTDKKSIKKMSLLRKILGFFILLFALEYYFFSKMATVITLIVVALIFLSSDIAKKYGKEKNKIVNLLQNIYPHKKEEDKRMISDATIALISMLIIILIFPRDIAIMSLIIYNFVDPAEKIFGIMIYGLPLPWNKDKTFIGAFFGFLTGAVSAIIAINLMNLEFSLFTIIIASIIAAIAGTAKRGDNVLIPWLTAIALFVATSP